MSNSVKNRIVFLIENILENPRALNAPGDPEELKYTDIEIWSRSLTKKDRIVYGIEPGSNYDFTDESEIIVFYQYLGHYSDK